MLAAFVVVRYRTQQLVQFVAVLGVGDYPIGVGRVEFWPDPDVLLAARRGARGCT